MELISTSFLKNKAINKLYVKILDEGCNTVCFTSVGIWEGITTITAYTAALAAKYGRKVLYCDFGNYNTSLSKQLNIDFQDNEDDFLKLSLKKVSYIEQFGFDLMPVPGPRPLDTSLIKKQDLDAIFDVLKKKYEMIFIDAHCYNKYQPYTLPAKLLCEVSDSSVLVILSGGVTVTEVKETTNDMLQNGIKLLGCVMNDRDYPGLRDELNKASQRIDKYFPKLGEFIRRKLRESEILNVEI